jgi:hypothetical protein
MKQTRLGSLSESVANVVAGYGIALVVYQLLMPRLGFDISIGQNLLVTTIFTFVGVLRHYTIRRIYEATLGRQV